MNWSLGAVKRDLKRDSRIEGDEEPRVQHHRRVPIRQTDVRIGCLPVNDFAGGHVRRGHVQGSVHTHPRPNAQNKHPGEGIPAAHTEYTQVHLWYA